MHDNPKDRGGSRISPSLALRLDGYFLHLNLPVFDYNYYFNLHCINFFGLFVLLSSTSVALCNHSPIALQIHKKLLILQIIFHVFFEDSLYFFVLFPNKKGGRLPSLFLLFKFRFWIFQICEKKRPTYSVSLP